MFAFRWIVVAAMLSAAAPAAAAERQPQAFGRLDLAGKLLSPQQFGPASTFAPAALGDQIAAEPPSHVVEAPAVTPAASNPAVTAAKPEKPRPAVAAKRPHRPAPSRNARRAPNPRAPANPMDSFARDTRGQAWPCKGDGICAWK